MLLTLSVTQKVMPDDHSEVVPLLPIPNRTVKRFCADDSADSRVKVGHRQASQPENAQSNDWAFFLVLKRVLRKTQKRDRIQGCTDHSESSENQDESQVLRDH